MAMTPTPPPVAFSHMGIFVRDLDRMEDFYRRVLGFTVTDRGDLGATRLVFLSRDPNEHHQIALVSGRPPESHFNVVNQISMRVQDVAALRVFNQILLAEGVDELRPVTHGNAISIYFRDPEGNRLEVFMDTPWYCLQPVRVPVDFSKSDAQILADAEKTARSLPDFKPRAAWVSQMQARMVSGGTA
jgi:catechol 2,3-dioxygenase